MSKSSHHFATPIFRGGRFESNTLPIDVLPDLAAYRDLVVDLAKHLFLQREPGRKRVPRGFVESFQLSLSAVEAGSAGAVLDRIEIEPSVRGLLPQAGLFSPQADLFDEARNLIEAVIAAAGNKSELPPQFPPHLAKRFNQIGRGLRDDEFVELRGPGKHTGPRYDKSIRKWIVVQQEGRYEDEVDLVAVLSGGVIDREQITLRLDDGALVDGRCPQHLVKHALGFAGRRIRVLGLGSYDRIDRLERVLRVDDITPIDEEENSGPAALNLQFDELKLLQRGWFEEDTPPLDPAGLDMFRSFLHSVLGGSDIPLPYLYPTPEGDARAEWSFPEWEVSATAELARRSIVLHATHLRSDAFEERELSMDATDGVVGFTKFIHQFMPAKVTS